MHGKQINHSISSIILSITKKRPIIKVDYKEKANYKKLRVQIFIKLFLKKNTFLSPQLVTLYTHRRT